VDGHFKFTVTLHVGGTDIPIPNAGEITALTASTAKIEREVTMPEIPGISTDPPAGDHHVSSGSDFIFHLTLDEAHAGMTPIVTTDRLVVDDEEGVSVTPSEDGGDFLVTIRRVQQPLNIFIRFGDENSNELINEGTKVWGEVNRLNILSDQSGEAWVHTVTGQLQAVVPLTGGQPTGISLPSGIYVVTLNGGKVHKVVIK
jgi:hypothetical protein